MVYIFVNNEIGGAFLVVEAWSGWNFEHKTCHITIGCFSIPRKVIPINGYPNTKSTFKYLGKISTQIFR